MTWNYFLFLRGGVGGGGGGGGGRLSQEDFRFSKFHLYLTNSRFCKILSSQLEM